MLHLINPDQLPPRARQEMERESERIWRRNGVTVRWLAAPGAGKTSQGNGGPSVDNVYVTVIGRQPDSGLAGNGRTLAAITFIGGHPTTRVRVYAGHAEHLLRNIGPSSLLVRDRPDTFQQWLLGRLVGRAVAHEVGHYLLDSADHAETGLMRRTLRTEDLAGADGAVELVLPGGDSCVTDQNRY